VTRELRNQQFMEDHPPGTGSAMKKIRKGDQVWCWSGRNKGRRGAG